MKSTLLTTAAWVFAAVALIAQSPLPDDFNPGADYRVSALALQPDGKILIVGVAGESSGRVARLNPDGTIDDGFKPSVTSSGGAGWGLWGQIALSADENILLGGHFANVNGQPRTNLARFSAAGTLDSEFISQAVGDSAYPDGMTALLLQSDGKILVGEACAWCPGALVRLDTDGRKDSAFLVSSLAYGPETMAMQEDGKILVGGVFDKIGGQSRTKLARLNPDGTLDPSFTPAIDGPVRPIAVQADGKILITGIFNSVAGQAHTNLARLNPDGTVDAAFHADVNSWVFWMAQQTDGKIVLGGQFTRVNGQSRVGLARLHPDGTLDHEFSPGVDGNGLVYSVAIQVDGKILVGGDFTTLGGLSRKNLGRLNNTGPATQSLEFDGSTVRWLRGGTSPEVWRTTFDVSIDGVSWKSLGAGRRIPGGWELSNISIPAGSTIRTRGFVAGGGWGEGLVEARVLVNAVTRPKIDIDGSLRSGSAFGFNITGNRGQTITVEASSNLMQWLPIWTNVLADTPTFFSESREQQRTRFYRVQTP
jgi:uncharacterized delta-60 repeat protein